MHKVQHRSLVVKDIHIQVLAAQHGIAYGHIDVGVVPRVKRIQEGTGAEQRGDKHREKK